MESRSYLRKQEFKSGRPRKVKEHELQPKNRMAMGSKKYKLQPGTYNLRLFPRKPSAHLFGKTNLPSPIYQHDNQLNTGGSSIKFLKPPLAIS
jgi:hypothetical protein